MALHLAARPLILKLWGDAERTGIPVTRPLWLQYPGDPVAAKQDQEWLLGPNVLVAPVVSQGARSRTVYFPAGCWRSPVTGARYHGPVSQTVAASLDQLPYFFACGTTPFKTASVRPRCPQATGGLAGPRLGPVRLGQTRGALRRKLPRFSTHGRRTMDYFCLAPQGIRVGYPSGGLLHSLSRGVARAVHGRAILALSSNRRYVLRGVRPGASFAEARRRLRLGRGYGVGTNTWYLIREGSGTGVLKARGGIVREVGIANRRLLGSSRAARRFLKSFK